MAYDNYSEWVRSLRTTYADANQAAPPSFFDGPAPVHDSGVSTENRTHVTLETALDEILGYQEFDEPVYRGGVELRLDGAMDSRNDLADLEVGGEDVVYRSIGDLPRRAQSAHSMLSDTMPPLVHRQRARKLNIGHM